MCIESHIKSKCEYTKASHNKKEKIYNSYNEQPLNQHLPFHNYKEIFSIKSSTLPFNYVLVLHFKFGGLYEGSKLNDMQLYAMESL